MIDVINGYDKKLNQVFTMCIAILGVLFVIVSFFLNALQNKNMVLNPNNIFSFIWIICLILTILICFVVLIFCIKGLWLQRFSVSNPDKLYNNYKSYSEAELKEFLIKQYGLVYKNNFEISAQIKDLYISSLKGLGYAVATTTILVIFSFIILRSVQLL